MTPPIEYLSTFFLKVIIFMGCFNFWAWAVNFNGKVKNKEEETKE